MNESNAGLQVRLEQLAEKLSQAADAQSSFDGTSVILAAIEYARNFSGEPGALVNQLMDARNELFSRFKEGGSYPEPNLYLLVAAIFLVHAVEIVPQYKWEREHSEDHGSVSKVQFERLAEIVETEIQTFYDWTPEKRRFG